MTVLANSTNIRYKISPIPQMILKVHCEHNRKLITLIWTTHNAHNNNRCNSVHFKIVYLNKGFHNKVILTSKDRTSRDISSLFNQEIKVIMGQSSSNNNEPQILRLISSNSKICLWSSTKDSNKIHINNSFSKQVYNHPRSGLNKAPKYHNRAPS